MKRILTLTLLVLGLGWGPLSGEEKESRETRVRAAVEKSLPLLLKAAQGHVEQKSCFACHNQALPMLAWSRMKAAGLAPPEKEIKKQSDFILEFLGKNRERFQSGQGTGGQADTAGYAMLTLELAGVKPNETTSAVVEYFLKHQAGEPHWKVTSNRPPSEASNFTTNYLALRAIRVWGAARQKERIEKRKNQVKQWLENTPGKETEDLAFRLLGLKECQAGDNILESAGKKILEKQQASGGWAQKDGMEVDPYATATALAALHLSGTLKSEDKRFIQGVEFLLQEQKADGSWMVKSRSKPFQAYYESGFPHGKDQFISVAASGWGTTVLLLALAK